MKKIDIDHLIELLKRCKDEGCREVVFHVEPYQNKEINLTIMQEDSEIIFTTNKTLY